MAPITPEYTAYVLGLLERAIAARHNDRGEGGAARVAEELGCTESLISQLRSGNYSSPARKYRQIVEKYGTETVACRILGEIALSRCRDERNLPNAAPSAAYVRQRRACQNCERRN